MKQDKKYLLIGSLCGLLLITGCTTKPKLSDGKEVEASIKGYTITADDFYSKLKDQYGESTLINMIDDYIANKEYKTTDDIKSYATDQVSTLKTQYGDSFSTLLSNYGYSTEDQLVDAYVLSRKKELAAKAYVKANLTDDELKDYYEKNVYGDITAKQILIKPNTTDSMSDTEKTAAEEKALATAKEVIKKLQNGEKWSDLVKKYSDDTASSKSDGLISAFNKDDVVSEFWDAALALKDGEYTTTPVKSTYGYHIILRVSQAAKASLKDVKSTISDKIVEQKFTDDTNLQKETWVLIRKKYKMSISDTAIEDLYNTYKATLAPSSTSTSTN